MYLLNLQVLYQSYVEHDVIMEQGQIGQSCFVLLAGSCDVRIKSQHDSLEEFDEEGTSAQQDYDGHPSVQKQHNGDCLLYYFLFDSCFNCAAIK